MAFGSQITEIELSPHKYLLHTDRLRKLAGGDDVFPVTVELDLVNYCNHHCAWCVDPAHGQDRFDDASAERLLNELRELDVMGIVYKGGGEPTLHPSFPHLLRMTRQLGFEAGLVTNGSRLADIHRAVAAYASYLRVSIDGPTPESHRAIHGSGDFHRIVEGVERVVELRRQHEQRHPVIGLSFAMDVSMCGLIERAVQLGDRLAVDYVLFRTPFFEEAGREPTMTVDQARQVRNAFDTARQRYNGTMKIMVDHWISDREADRIETTGRPSPRRGTLQKKHANGIEHLTGRCLASPLLAVVAGDKRIYPCCNLRALDAWCVGAIDYERGQTFKRIWEGSQRRRVMDRIRKAKCIRHCTHPLSKYNEAIEYLAGPGYHGGFV